MISAKYERIPIDEKNNTNRHDNQYEIRNNINRCNNLCEI